MKHLMAALLLVMLAACGSSTQPSTQTENVLPPAYVHQSTASTISSLVVFKPKGAVSVMPMIDMSSNPQFERQHKKPQKLNDGPISPAWNESQPPRADETFTLKGMPQGIYTIQALHKKYGRKECKLALAANGSATPDFTYGG